MNRKVTKWHVCSKCLKLGEKRSHPSIDCTRGNGNFWLGDGDPSGNNMAHELTGLGNMENSFNVRDYLNEEELSPEEIERAEFRVTANRVVRETGECNYKRAKIPLGNKWDLVKLEEWLGPEYEDKQIIEYLKYGWPLNAKDTEVQDVIPSNQTGAKKNVKEVREYLRKEWERGSLIGPFTKNPFGKFARISPLDTRPKKDSEELRIILNLSHPFEEGSVNQSIDKITYTNGEAMELSYLTTDDLAKLVRRKGRNCKIFIRDLRRAYRQLWSCPSTIHLLGFMYDNRFYFDITLSMGSRSAAYCCQRTTNALSHVYRNFGFEDVNYLDDLGAAETEDRAEEAYDCLGYVLNTIGVEESKEKVKPPSNEATFLGVPYNTLKMTMSIKPERIRELQELLAWWDSKTSATLHELQVLLGKLNFVCSTVRAGRIFVSRLINEISGFPKNGKRRLNKETKKGHPMVDPVHDRIRWSSNNPFKEMGCTWRNYLVDTDNRRQHKRTRNDGTHNRLKSLVKQVQK